MLTVKITIVDGGLVWSIYHNGELLSEVNQEQQVGSILAAYASDLQLIEESTFQIVDWTGKLCFDGITFTSFKEGDEWLKAKIEELYPDTIENDERFFKERGEYYVELKGE